MVKYGVQLEGNGSRFRLQKSGSWRSVGPFDKLKSSDFRTKDPEMVMLMKRDASVKIGGVFYRVEPTAVFVGDEAVLWYAPYVFRKKFPNTPDRDQLRDVLISGDDGCINSLVLIVNGEFELRQVPPFDFSEKDPRIIVRHETFSASSYVGSKADDPDYIDETYRDMLAFWVEHARSGKTDAYCDERTHKTLDELQEELSGLKSGWKPKY